MLYKDYFILIQHIWELVLSKPWAAVRDQGGQGRPGQAESGERGKW